MRINLFNKLFSVFLIFIVLFLSVPAAIDAEIYYPELNAEANLLMNADSGTIYLADSIDEPLAIASLSKLMSIYIVFEEMEEQGVKLDDTTKMSKRASGIKVSNPVISGVLYNEGQEVTYDTLIKHSIVLSDNGAIIQLAEDLSGSEQAHVKKMNEKAKELGMEKTNFVNVTGLTMRDYNEYTILGTNEDDYNVSSARDLGLLCYNLLKDYPQILDLTQITNIEYQGYDYSTYNNMLPGQVYEYDGVKGMKTGTSKEAGECFIGYFEDEDRNYLSIVLGAPSTPDANRFTETIKIYDWAVEQRYVDILNDDVVFTEVNIDGGTGGKIPLYTGNVDFIDSNRIYFEIIDVEYNQDYFDENNYLRKDIPKGSVIGTVVYNTPSGEEKDSIYFSTVFGEQNELRVDLRAKEDIKQQNIFTKFFLSIKMFFDEVFNSF